MKYTGKIKGLLQDNHGDIYILNIVFMLATIMVLSGILLLFSLYVMTYNVKYKVNSATNNFMTDAKCNFYSDIVNADLTGMQSNYNASTNDYYRYFQQSTLIDNLTDKLKAEYNNGIIVSTKPSCTLSNISMNFDDNVCTVKMTLTMKLNLFSGESSFYTTDLVYSTTISKKDYS